MILDDLIVFVSALFGALVGIPILLINLIAAMAEAIVSLVGGSLELGRITNPLRKKKDRDQESSESSSKIVAGLFVIIVVIGLLIFAFNKIWYRNITFVASDGHSIPYAEILIENGSSSDRQRTDSEGELTIPRFTTDKLTIHSSRFVEKSWTKEDFKDELVVERTILGSSLDKAASFLLKKAKDSNRD